ncbi:hypothetical protein N7478_001739 [Penicillium angulare]|uniref:uncharacterized protein n=1 Tax=Penicillium angulare TaxID=116970 RepID=UPI002540C7CD|nr:uncharacterized protein N7478_001739 [Penicillium angulare]KAJ5288709.1 hypothetical protein N7478_001739 [Penicillium angulare]
MAEYNNTSINPAIIFSGRNQRSSQNLNNNEMNEQDALSNPYMSNNDGLGWPGGSNLMTESGGSSYPTSFFTEDTSHTSDNPEYRLSASTVLPQPPEPVFGEMMDHHDGNPHPLVSVGVQFPYDFPPHQVPQILDSDLHDYHGDLNDTEEDSPSPVEKHQDIQETVNLERIGVPGRPDHPSNILPQHELLQEMYYGLGNKFFQRLNPGTSNEDSRESLVQFQQGLDTLRQNVDTMLHNHEPKVSVAERLLDVPGSSMPTRKHLYRCKIPNCTSDTTFPKVETFKRHIDAQHFRKISYYCTQSGCDRSEARRDKLLQHCMTRHLIKPRKSEVDRKKKAEKCPIVCAICPRMTRSWNEFLNCIIGHSVVEDDAVQGGPSSSERDNQGNGDADAAPSNGSFFPRTGAARLGGITTSQIPSGYGNVTARRVSSSLLSPNSPLDSDTTASDMFRGFSDGINLPQAPPNGLQGVQEGRRSSDSHLHPDVLQRPRYPQQPPPPPPPRPRQPDMGLQERLQCHACGHLFNQRCCRQQNPRERCHECAARMHAVRLQIPQAHWSNRRGPLDAVAPMYQQMRNYGAPMNVPFGEVVYQPQQPPHQRPSGGRGTSFPGYFGDHYNVSMLTSINVPGLSEGHMESLLDSKTVNPPFGFTWLSRLPIRVPSPKGMINVPRSAGAIPLDYNGPVVLPQVDLPLNTIQDNQCRCPCRLKALERSYTKARVELAPGRVLDVKMKILANDRSSHPLRTRVRVVVKLLKLRSSVARPNNKKKTEEEARAIKKALKTSLDVPDAESGSKSHSIKFIENIDDINDPDGSDLDSDDTCSDSDTESVTSSVSATSSISEFSVQAESKPGSPDVSGEPFPNEFNNFDDGSLPPSSFSDDTHDLDEITPYHHQGCDHPFFTDEAEEIFAEDLEETELEVALDLDLQTCLSRLSIPTDGLVDFDQPDLDQKITDPNHIFQYFVRYILYVIVALSNSRKHGSPSLLE